MKGNLIKMIWCLFDDIDFRLNDHLFKDLANQSFKRSEVNFEYLDDKLHAIIFRNPNNIEITFMNLAQIF